MTSVVPKLTINGSPISGTSMLQIICNTDNSAISFWMLTTDYSVNLMKAYVSNQYKNEIVITDANGSDMQIIIADAGIVDSAITFANGGQLVFNFKGYHIT